MAEDTVFAAAYAKYLQGEAARRTRREALAKLYVLGWMNVGSEESIVGRSKSRLYVIGEDGLGDEVFYLRFMPTLARQCKEVTWVTSWSEDGISQNDNSKLLPLLESGFQNCPNVSFARFHRDLMGKGDTIIFSKELVKFFGATKEEFKRNSHLPSIVASPQHTAQLKQRYGKDGRTIVGLAWHSEGGKLGKSAPLDLPGWNEMFAEDIKERCSFVSIQYDYSEFQQQIDLAQSRNGVDIYNDPEIDIVNDLASAALQVNACDVIISISTTAAHLAVAMDKKTILLLPNDPIVHWDLIDSYPNPLKARGLSLEAAAQELRRTMGLF
jgi:hypothetical protein